MGCSPPQLVQDSVHRQYHSDHASMAPCVDLNQNEASSQNDGHSRIPAGSRPLHLPDPLHPEWPTTMLGGCVRRNSNSGLLNIKRNDIGQWRWWAYIVTTSRSCLAFLIKTMYNMRCFSRLYRHDCLSDPPAPPPILSPLTMSTFTVQWRSSPTPWRHGETTMPWATLQMSSMEGSAKAFLREATTTKKWSGVAGDVAWTDQGGLKKSMQAYHTYIQ